MSAGAIDIVLSHRDGEAVSAEISSSRPESPARMLIGKTPEQVLATVPLLFSLCGNAQSYAALLACRAASESVGNAATDVAREMLVLVETLREHAWRILLDWPKLLGREPDKKSLAELMKFDALFKRCLFGQGEAFRQDTRLSADKPQLDALIYALAAAVDRSIFDGRMETFLELSDETQLQRWLAHNKALCADMLNDLYRQYDCAAGQNEIACLPDIKPEALHLFLSEQNLTDFSRLPHWQGRCFESSPLNRGLTRPLSSNLHGRYGNGLIVRLVGRLLEPAGIPSLLRCLSRQLTNNGPLASQYGAGGTGLAKVQAARGLLLHRLQLRDGLVADYCIVAPTEWNFHPEGVVAEGLKRLSANAPDDLARQAERYINAVDPCVQYTLNLRPLSH